MHTGLRHDRDGKLVPAPDHQPLHGLRYDGDVALSVDLEPAVSADPYIEFEMAVPGSGVLEFEWVDDDGSVYRLRREIAVG